MAHSVFQVLDIPALNRTVSGFIRATSSVSEMACNAGISVNGLAKMEERLLVRRPALPVWRVMFRVFQPQKRVTAYQKLALIQAEGLVPASTHMLLNCGRHFGPGLFPGPIVGVASQYDMGSLLGYPCLIPEGKEWKLHLVDLQPNRPEDNLLFLGWRGL